MPEYARVCQSMPEYTRVCQSLAKFCLYERKTARYERLAGDLREMGYKASNIPFEIGCRGTLNARNSVVLETLCNILRTPGRQKLKGALGRIALLGSYRIWLARHSQEWTGGELIRVT